MDSDDYDDENDDSFVQDDTNQQVWSAEKLVQASYKELGSPAVVEERFYRHLMRDPSCVQSLRNLLAENSTTTRDYSVTIDAFDLLDNDPILGQMLLRFPATLLPLLENAIVRGQKALLQEYYPQDSADIEALSIKGLKQGPSVTRVHARLVHLPPSCCQTTWSAASVGKILQVSGTVVRTRPVQMYESARAYTCSNCKRPFIVHADLEERHNALPTPTSCPHQCKGKCKFQIVPEGSVHTDYQEIKLQESTSDEKLPRSLLVKLHHDLVDTCQPGDEVVIVGSLLAQWQSVFPEEECSVGLALSAHSVRVIAETAALQSTDHFRGEFETYWRNNHRIKARDFICQAVCPKLYGMKMIKLGLLLTIIGGASSDATDENLTQRRAGEDDEGPIPFQVMTNQTRDEPVTNYYDGQRKARKPRAPQQVQTRRRHQSHLLLVGDPGTGKSQFLRFAAALSPRSVLTTGVGTTSAGLTCAAVRDGDGKEYSLEAGALVLADKGVCCIDEFGCIRDQDRTTIHEAMEQQTLSVAKAGIVCKLNCRATIIAVMNPRDCLYDDHVSLSVNTGLGTPLLSRFDLIFKLIDSSDADRDYNVTTYLLNQSIQSGNFEMNAPEGEESPCRNTPWNMEKLRAYISIVKDRFQPSISDEAALLLERHYEKCRSYNGNTTIPVTVRFLESLIRLSQAHARLMFRSVVLLEDAVAVLEVMECTAFACGGFDGNDHDGSYCDPMTIDFCDDPDSDFICHQYRTLHRYNMLNHMDEDMKKKASALLSQTALGVPKSWKDVENPSPSFELNAFEPTMTQDHYGRFHFDRSQSKRPRM